ncbi:MFS transporter [Thalassobacillus sp. CUG 92003]|uniref:MFS transporter n=1 Tax=Thalassobacillus sp. CUG 92003 TaxID=2736641 RepID=UPI0015E65C4D|nr:MFS transporter [Thalassobacillus sp. CUG 92003]
MKRIHYGWFILLLSFLALLTVQGFRSSIGAFIIPWEHAFKTDRSTISLLVTFSLIIYGISQPLIGKMIDQWGIRNILSFSTLMVGLSAVLIFFVTQPWQLFMLYGIVASIGFGGASGVAATVAVANWFQKKKGLALGIITSGMSAGQLVFVPLSLFLINRIAWEWTVLALGTFLSVIAFPLLFVFLRTFPYEKGIQPYGGYGLQQNNQKDHGTNANATNKSKRWFNTRKFWYLALPYFICGYTTMGLMDTHLIPFSHGHGFTDSATGIAVSLLAAFNIIGTLLSGQISDQWSPKHFLALLYSLRAISIILLLVMDHTFLLFTFAILFGLVDFATITPTSVLATEYFKQHSVGFTLGLLSLSHQVGAALGAYIPGVLYNLTGGYNTAFVSAIVLLLMATLLSLVLPETKQQSVSQYSGIKSITSNSKNEC